MLTFNNNLAFVIIVKSCLSLSHSLRNCVLFSLCTNNQYSFVINNKGYITHPSISQWTFCGHAKFICFSGNTTWSEHRQNKIQEEIKSSMNVVNYQHLHISHIWHKFVANMTICRKPVIIRYKMWQEIENKSWEWGEE